MLFLYFGLLSSSHIFKIYRNKYIIFVAESSNLVIVMNYLDNIPPAGSTTRKVEKELVSQANGKYFINVFHISILLKELSWIGCCVFFFYIKSQILFYTTMGWWPAKFVMCSFQDVWGLKSEYQGSLDQLSFTTFASEIYVPSSFNYSGYLYVYTTTTILFVYFGEHNNNSQCQWFDRSHAKI